MSRRRKRKDNKVALAKQQITSFFSIKVVLPMILACLLFTSIGYASLNTQLNITGTGVLDPAVQAARCGDVLYNGTMEVYVDYGTSISLRGGQIRLIHDEGNAGLNLFINNVWIDGPDDGQNGRGWEPILGEYFQDFHITLNNNNLTISTQNYTKTWRVPNGSPGVWTAWDEDWGYGGGYCNGITNPEKDKPPLDLRNRLARFPSPQTGRLTFQNTLNPPPNVLQTMDVGSTPGHVLAWRTAQGWTIGANGDVILPYGDGIFSHLDFSALDGAMFLEVSQFDVLDFLFDHSQEFVDINLAGLDVSNKREIWLLSQNNFAASRLSLRGWDMRPNLTKWSLFDQGDPTRIDLRNVNFNGGTGAFEMFSGACPRGFRPPLTIWVSNAQTRNLILPRVNCANIVVTNDSAVF